MERYDSRQVADLIQIPICDKTVTSELSGDFSLPDYQPEIKRLLRVSASVMPSAKYFGASNAEFSGNIDYYVLYMGSDNGVYCAPLVGEYIVNLPFDADALNNIDGDIGGSAEIIPDTVSGRVTGPRKLNIRCRLKSHAKIWGESAMRRELGGDMDPSCLEKLVGEMKTAKVSYGVGNTLHLNDEMISDRSAGEVRVICADGRVMMSEVSSADGGVNCRGEVYIKLLMSREEGNETYSVLRKIPFTQYVETEGADLTCCAYAKGTVSELSVDVEEGRINTEVGVMIEVTAQKNQSVSYLRDMYSTNCESVCEYKKLTVPSALSCFNGNFTLGDSTALDGVGISPDARIADVLGSVSIEEHRCERGKMIIDGKARFNLLLERGGEYSVSELEFPFKYETECNSEAAECEICANVISCRARIDGERVGIDAEIAVCGRIWESNEIKCLCAIHFGELPSRSRGEFVICFPSSDDSIWSVAQRYRAKISELSAANKLVETTSPDDPSTLAGVSYLIV